MERWRSDEMLVAMAEPASIGDAGATNALADAQRVELLDGAEVTVRPIRADDRRRLLEGFNRLSPESRYRRFLSPATGLTAGQLAYLTDVDHHDHEALVAVDVATGAGVGVARFIRSDDDPRAAEFAVAVLDSWHGRGVGTVLLALLIDRAREEGIERFLGTVLSWNRPMLELLREFGTPRVVDTSGDVLELSIALPDEGLGQQLPALLRLAAIGQMDLGHPGRV